MAGEAVVQRVVGSFLDHLTVERGASGNTVAAYRRDLTRYQEFLDARGIEAVTAVTEADVAAFASALHAGGGGRGGLAPTSGARALCAVESLHRFARQHPPLRQRLAPPALFAAARPMARTTIAARRVACPAVAKWQHRLPPRFLPVRRPRKTVVVASSR